MVARDSLDYEADLGYPDVRVQLLEGVWETVCSRSFKSLENITVLEGRAHIYALRRCTRSVRHHDCEMLFLIDNFGLCMALDKQRASDYSMLRICQQSAALCLASGIRPRRRWVPSE